MTNLNLMTNVGYWEELELAISACIGCYVL